MGAVKLKVRVARGVHTPVAVWACRCTALVTWSPAQYVSVSLATCVGLCRFGEAWAALWAENLLTYLVYGPYRYPELLVCARFANLSG